MLYIVGTPIGNLGDMTFRAIETLKSVDFIAAEDTRVTVKLLNHFDIQKPMVSYYSHNLRERGEYIIGRIKGGQSCAIVTDAGMPCISDPGEDLVKLCVENGVKVTVVPGSSAAVSALALSGQNTSRFTFEGFLSTSKSSRMAHLESLKSETRTMIFYEAPHKLLKTLRDMREAWGERSITIARELTKLYEEILYTNFSDAILHFKEKEPRGEFVLVIKGSEAAEDKAEQIPIELAVSQVQALVAQGDKLTDACKAIAKQTGHKRSELYRLSANDI